ncbi:N-acetylgalactosaminyltransferase 6-like [Penaeus monodon]|uniref:N-acetylgalactosaminyltransferase 6-like n=1 Tax=Penaeus monodon TaxID=6687 RepID=UPI0018A6DB92|nr:N-acetylgalactosaminyltransferase 6-like [Penaeus monodon]
MINYHLQLPKKMGFKLLYPRRRGLIFKILAFCTFIGFVGLWFKNDPLVGEEDELLVGRAKGLDGGPNHIPALDKSKTHRPLGQVAQPDDQILRLDDLPDHEPVREIRVPAPGVAKDPQFQAPARHRNLPSNEDMIERMKADRMFAEDEAKVVRGLGEGGRPVRLTGEEGRRAEDVLKKEAFNLVASDKISLNRSVPDSRDPL